MEDKSSHHADDDGRELGDTRNARATKDGVDGDASGDGDEEDADLQERPESVLLFRSQKSHVSLLWEKVASATGVELGKGMAGSRIILAAIRLCALCWRAADDVPGLRIVFADGVDCAAGALDARDTQTLQ